MVIEAMIDHRGASAALAQLSEQASIIVFGNRGRGRVTGALLGSVAFAVAMHAHTPTVVVRGDTAQSPGPSRPVVVGVDGSDNKALDHAADIAVEAGAELHALVAWQGDPEQVLAQASADAGLVVVGARGRGDLASLLLGSVSRAVIHGAMCPVTIVR